MPTRTWFSCSRSAAAPTCCDPRRRDLTPNGPRTGTKALRFEQSRRAELGTFAGLFFFCWSVVCAYLPMYRRSKSALQAQSASPEGGDPLCMGLFFDFLSGGGG